MDDAPLPRGLTVTRVGGDARGGYRESAPPTIIVTRTWRPTPHGRFAPLTLVVAALCGGLLGLAIHRGFPGLSSCSAPVLAVWCVTGGYVGLANLLNRTILRIEPRRIAIDRGPIPWRGVRELAITELTRVYVSSAVVRGGPVYFVNAGPGGSGSQTLFPSLDDMADASRTRDVIQHAIDSVR